MQLTNLILSDFITGQIEIKNESNGTNRRGQITNIIIGDSGKITVTCDWMALMDEPDLQTGILIPIHNYFIDCSLYNVCRLGPDDTEHNDVFCFQSEVMDDFILLHPPDGNLINVSAIRTS